MKLNKEAKEEANAKKEHVAEVLAMLAGAIQEDQLATLAREVTKWGKANLKNWKKSP